MTEFLSNSILPRNNDTFKFLYKGLMRYAGGKKGKGGVWPGASVITTLSHVSNTTKVSILLKSLLLRYIAIVYLMQKFPVKFLLTVPEEQIS